MSEPAQMPVSAARAPAVEPRDIGPKGLVEIFYAPGHVFENLTRKSWWIPFIACLLIAVISFALLDHFVGMETMVRNRMQGNEDHQKVEQAVAMAVRMTPLYYVMFPIGGAVVLLISASVLLLVNMMAGAQTPFGRTLAVTSYSFFATGVVRTIALTAVLASVKDFEGFDLENPLPLNPGFFIDRSSKFLHSLASSFDLITLWGIFLIALGLHKAFPKASTGKFFGMIVAVWLIYVLGKSAAASLFRFGG